MPTEKQKHEIVESGTAFNHTYGLLKSGGVREDVLCYAMLTVALQKITDTHGAVAGMGAVRDIVNQHAARVHTPLLR